MPFCPLHQERAQCSSLYHDVCSDAARVASSSVSKDDGGPNTSNVCINGRTQEVVSHCVCSRLKHAPRSVCPQHAYTYPHRRPQTLGRKPWLFTLPTTALACPPPPYRDATRHHTELLVDGLRRALASLHTLDMPNCACESHFPQSRRWTGPSTPFLLAD